jgi:hypothetical protein
MSDVIAIQVFNKPDSAVMTLQSVARCSGSENYHLFILQDGLIGSKQVEQYQEPHAETSKAVRYWIDANRHNFLSIWFDCADRNYGPYSTAERLINEALDEREFVIFSEDDVVFEEDAIQWFERLRNHTGFLLPNVWAIAGESKFFDARSHVPSTTDIHQALEVAQRQNLIDRFVYFDFVPSSCFATNRAKWSEFGKTRGGPNGDRDVCLRCRAEGKVCLWPVVARCRDVGMHHPLGYSVRWRGTSHPVFKNSYILSGMFNGDSAQLIELEKKEAADLSNQFIFRWRD